jgi:hypothetical protein
VKRPTDTHERDTSIRPHQPQDSVTEESDIDQILADSFPASDAPSWTLGVTSARVSGVRERKEPRG